MNTNDDGQASPKDIISFNEGFIEYLLNDSQGFDKGIPVLTLIIKLPFNYTYEEINRLFAFKFFQIINKPQYIKIRQLQNRSDTDEGESISKQRKIGLTELLRQNFSMFQLKQHFKYFLAEHNIKHHLIESCLLAIINRPQEIVNYQILERIINKDNIATQESLDHNDFLFIQNMLQHKSLENAILDINRIQNPSCSQTIAHENARIILNRVQEQKLVVIDIQDYAYTSRNGQIFINRFFYPFNDNTKNVKRLLRIVTLIHEMYGHLNRLMFTHNQNVLQSTPDLVVSGNLKVSEAGDYIEYRLFGQKIRLLNITEKFLEEFFTESYWLESIELGQFLDTKNYQLLEVQLQGPPKHVGKRKFAPIQQEDEPQ